MAVPHKISSTETRYVSSTADVLPNRVVMPDTAVAADEYGFRKVKHATAGATNFLGVSWFGGSAATQADTVMVKPRRAVTVQGAPITARVQFAAAAADGEPLICAADGAVTPGTTANAVVGWAVGDVAAAGVGYIKLAR